MANERITEAITELFGPRCRDYVESCPCCDAWREFDALARARNDALEEAAQVAGERSAMLSNDSDMTRGYACGRTDAAAAIRTLKSKEPQS